MFTRRLNESLNNLMCLANSVLNNLAHIFFLGINICCYDWKQHMILWRTNEIVSGLNVHILQNWGTEGRV